MLNLLTNRLIRKLFSFIFVILLILPSTFIYFTKPAIAATLTNVSDTLTRLKVSEASSHTITFDLGASTSIDGTETIAIDFGEDDSKFTVDGATDAITDYAVSVDRSGSPVALTIVGVDGDCAGHTGVSDMAVNADNTTGIITFTACGSFTSSDNNATVTIQIGSAAGGVNIITNPSAASTYSVSITAAADTGTYNVPILTDDQVVVSATVNPSLSVTISSTTCDLGTLNTTDINTCNYSVTVTTNSTNGYLATITEDGNLRTSGGASITDESGGGTIVGGTEEYGVATSSSAGTNDIATYVSCTSPAADPQVATAIDGTAKQFAAATTTVSSEATTLCHAATIAGTTTSGSYSHTVTLIVTARY